MEATAEQRNNKRIAKNTLLLYFRMLITMAVSLYTSRVVLRTLGVEDFGIYNVVGGVVAMFGVLNMAMSSTTQRYITFSLGKGDEKELKKVFFNCVLTHFLIASIFVLLAEMIGLWFLNNKLVIPADRLSAAFWVFQCSVLSTFIMIISVPYNADIVAHEKMSAFAYISIVEVFLKLAIVWILCISPIDRLCLYAILLAAVQLGIRFIYGIYCRRHFNETHLQFQWDVKLFKEMLSFAGWNLFGGLSNILYTQGLNILLNIFFGPAVNAARGVSVQVQNAVFQFSHSFQMAVNPQITKSYAGGNLSQMHLLIFSSSKYTVLLLLLLTTPFFTNAEFILNLWLKNVPEWSEVFVRLMLCITIIDAAANPFMIASAATGRIRFYQFVIGGTMLLIVPSAYIALKFGCSPYVVFVVHLIFCLITFVARLFIVRSMVHFKILEYVKKYFCRYMLVLILVFLMALACNTISERKMVEELLIIVGTSAMSLLFCFFIGLSTTERVFVINKVKSLSRRLKW